MRRWDVALLLGVLLLVSPHAALAQITLDGTLGPAGTPPKLGGAYTIGAELGQTRGRNLFHSFGQFNVLTGESATFTSSASSTIQNILSRVTGGSASFIDGLLRSTIPGANVFLLNPRGIVFGPNASLDIGGAFHASTADYIRLADGARFAASPGVASTLSTAPPAAFGFLGPTVAPITIAGSTLQVAPRQTLSVVGGDVQIAAASLVAPAGRINVASVGSAGEVVIGSAAHPLAVSAEGFTRLGTVDVVQSLLDTSGDAGGTVAIRGGAARIESSLLLADTLGNTAGARVGVDITATESLRLLDSALVATAQGTGDAGRIEITAPAVAMERSAIATATFASGRAGDIALDVGKLEMSGGASIESSAFPFTAGHAGNVTIRATDRVVMTGADNVVSSVTAGAGDAGRVAISTPLLAMDRGRLATATFDVGRAGDIEVDAGTVALQGGSGIDSRSFTSGAGGAVRVTAAESVVVTGVNAVTGLFSSIASNAFGGGPAGEVTITTPVLRVADGAAISAETTGAGRAGGIIVRATDVFVTGAGRISSSTFGPGDGGPVAIVATGTVSASGNGSNIVSSSSGSGHAGQLAISASTLAVDGGMVGATALDVGNAGNVDIDVGRLSVTAAGVVDSSTLVQGDGGTVTITARDGVSISGRDADGLLSRVSSSTIGTGDAGRVTISTPVLVIDAGLVSAVTAGSGRGGDVVLNVGRLVVTNEGAVGADTMGTGAGGTLSINATESVALSRGSFLSTLTAGPGHAGRLTVVTPELTVESSAAIAAPSGGVGAAGDVIIDVGRLTLTSGATITSSTEGAGGGGTVSVVARESVVVAGAGLDAKPSGITTRSLGDAAAGQVFVQAPTLVLQGPAQISAATTGAGRAGDVRLAVDALSLTGGAVVSSETTGAGRGGTITLTGSTIDVAGSGSRISSNASGAGAAGDIDLAAREIRLSDGARISSTSGGLGDAGNIRITASTALESLGSAVTTAASSADGGNIAIGVGTLLRLVDSQITATVGGGEGRGGNIVITGPPPAGEPVQFVTLRNSEIRADASRGPGGSVQITADVVLSERPLTDVISASSAFGLSGTVDISSPITDVSGTLARLPQNILVAASLLREACGPRFAERPVSSLAVGGRDVAPAGPGGVASSPLVGVESPARTGVAEMAAVALPRLPVIELRCGR